MGNNSAGSKLATALKVALLHSNNVLKNHPFKVKGDY